MTSTPSTPFDPDDAAAPGSGIYGLPVDPDGSEVIIIPVPWEPTTSYRKGTVAGPAAVLEASYQVDLQDLETGRPYERGITMLDPDPDVIAWNDEADGLAQPIIDRGGAVGDPELEEALARVNQLSDQLNARVEQAARAFGDRGKLVCILGGDHAVPFGAIAAAAARHPGLGVLHLDAHSDLREAYEGFTFSHASIMHNVVTRIPGVSRLVQVGIRDVARRELALVEASGGRVQIFSDPDLATRRFEGETWAAQCARILAPLPDHVYLSWDIDGLNPVDCPNTGTPVPGGLTFNEASYLLRALVASGRRVVGLDLCEVAGEEWDAVIGARLLYKMIGWALKSRR